MKKKNVDFGFVGFDGTGSNSNGTSISLYSAKATSVWLPQWSTEASTMISHGFFSVFAVFFPAVTGIMAGANMSGDLKNPSEDIPKGTIRAIVLTYITYVGLLWIIGFTSLRCSDVDMNKCPTVADQVWAKSIGTDLTLLPEGGLLYNKLIVVAHSLWAPLVYVGVFAATLSSALASIVGAPRILQSLAGDKIFPWPVLEFFAKGSGAGNEPLRGYVLTYFLGTACCLVGQLDVIAPIIANFFMISYGVTNYACYAAHESKSPSWRPTFKYYNPWLSLFGGFLCIVCMFLMDWANSLVSCGVSLVLFLYLHHIQPDTNWGPASEARKYISALRGLEELESNAKEHVKTFRPQLLFMSGDPQSRLSLLGFAVSLRAARGAMVMGNVIITQDEEEDQQDEQQEKGEEGKVDTDATAATELIQVEMTVEEKQRKIRETTIKNLTESERVRDEMYKFIYNNEKAPELKKSGIMCETVVASNLLSGFTQILQLGGLGRLRPNTVCFGFKKDWKTCSNESASLYESMVASSLANGRGVIIVRDPKQTFQLPGLISNDETNNTVEINAKNEEGEEASLVETNAGSKSPSNGGIQMASVRSMSTANRLGKTLMGTQKKEKRRIDVYWLADDGGLTALIPHLIRKHKDWKDSRIEFYGLSKGDGNQGATVKMQASQARLSHLLDKIRIAGSITVCEANLKEMPALTTLKHYQTTATNCIFDPMLPEGWDGQGDEGFKDELRPNRVSRMLRLSELVAQFSGSTAASPASLVFVMLPIPKEGTPAKQYCSLLNALSASCQCPTIFIRGNHKDVLTLYS